MVASGEGSAHVEGGGPTAAARPGQLPPPSGRFPYHVVNDRRPAALSRRARWAASAACAGLLVAAVATVGRWAGRGGVVLEAAAADLVPETVIVTIPRGTAAGRMFDFDVPGRGEFSALVPADKQPGDQLELKVNGMGAPLEHGHERAVKVHLQSPVGNGAKHVMYEAVVPTSAAHGAHFTVDVPGTGDVTVNIPAGKQPGDTVLFRLPPPEVRGGLPHDSRPVLARIMPAKAGQQLHRSLPKPLRVASPKPPRVASPTPLRIAAPKPPRVSSPVPFPKPPAVLPAGQRTKTAQGQVAAQQPAGAKHPPKSQEVSVQVPVDAGAGEILVVKGSGGNEYEVTVPAGVKPGSSFLAMLPVEPPHAHAAAAAQPAAKARKSATTAMHDVAPGRMTALAGTDLSDAVSSAVTSAVTDAVQEAAVEAEEEEAKKEDTAPAKAPAEAAAAPAPAAETPVATAAPAPAPVPAAAPAPAVSTAPEKAAVAPAPVVAPAEVEPPAAPPQPPAAAPQVPVEAPASVQSPPTAEAAVAAGNEGLGHRNSAEAFDNQEPIAAQEVPEEYEGEAVAAPEASTNQFQVTVYEPLAKPGRRNRGIASTWDPYNEAWKFDASKARAQADFTWLDEPGVWQEIDSYMGHKKPDPRYLSGGFSEEEEQAMHAKEELGQETRR